MRSDWSLDSSFKCFLFLFSKWSINLLIGNCNSSIFLGYTGLTEKCDTRTQQCTQGIVPGALSRVFLSPHIQVAQQRRFYQYGVNEAVSVFFLPLFPSTGLRSRQRESLIGTGGGAMDWPQNKPLHLCVTRYWDAVVFLSLKRRPPVGCLQLRRVAPNPSPSNPYK